MPFLLCGHSEERHQAQLLVGEDGFQNKELEPPLSTILHLNPRMPTFQVDMTLDVDIAISDNMRHVCCDYFKKNCRECIERFKHIICVLGSPKSTSSHQYWEVEVDVGTSKERNMRCLQRIC